MKVDVHINSCHRHDIFARQTHRDTWTQSEKKEITKISLDSIIKLFNNQKKFGHEIQITVLDDGSDQQDIIDYFNSNSDIHVKFFEKQGTGPCTTQHIESLDADLTIHLEDDQILFNPYGLDFISIFKKFLDSELAKKHNIDFLTCYSGHDSVLGTSWFSPKYNLYLEDIEFIHIPYVGNTIFITTPDLFKKVLPITSSSGEAEIELNDKLKKLGIQHGQLNIPLFSFHSHILNREMPEIVNTTILRKWEKNIQYGILNMHEYLLNKNPIYIEVVNNFKDKTFQSTLIDTYEY